jgi:hypothetical protein
MYKDFEEDVIKKNISVIYTNLLDFILIIFEICDKKKISLNENNEKIKVNSLLLKNKRIQSNLSVVYQKTKFFQ